MSVDPKGKSRLTLPRFAGLAAVSVAASLLITFAASAYLRWSSQRAQRAFRAEMEAHALGANPPTPENFFPMQVVQRPDLVSGLQFKDVAGAEENNAVVDDETVLAVRINGQARAYPINMMTGPDREIFNDTLGGQAIAATW